MICNTQENLIKTMESMPFFKEGSIVDLAAFLDFIEETRANAVDKYGTNKDLNPIKEIEGNTPIWNAEYFENANLQVHMFNVANEERLGFQADLHNTPTENLQKPVNINYFEFLAHKQAQLQEVQKRIRRVQTQVKQNATAINRAKLSKLAAVETTLENQLEALKEQEEDFMFNAIEEDLANLNTSFEEGDIHDMQDVRETLEFYEDFMSSILESDKAAEIIKSIVASRKKYTEYTEKVVKETMEDSSLIEKTLEYLNKDKAPGDKLVTISDLNKANKDLSLADSLFLGITSSTTGDTVLPQHLQVVFRQAFAYHNERVKRLTDRLDRFNQQHPNVDREQLFALDADGNKNGELKDLYNNDWYNSTNLFKTLTKSFYNAKNADRANQYNKVVDWYERNAEILDITKLPEVQAVYGVAHQDKFTSSPQEMAAYQTRLKQQLGPRYQDIIDDTLRSIYDFETFRAGVDPSNPYANKNVAQRDIWSYSTQINRGEGKRGIEYEYVGGKAEAYFSAFNTLPLIPKIADNIPNYYSESFNELRKDPAAIELWGIYKGMSEQIDSTYAIDNMGRIKYPKFKTQMLESLEQQITLMKKGKFKEVEFWDTVKASLTSIKSIMYEKGADSRNAAHVVENYGDASQKEIVDLAQVYVMKGIEKSKALARAQGEVLKKYSGDLDRNYKALLVQSAMHDARLEVAPIADSVLEVFSNIKDSKGQTRVNAIKRLEYFVDKIVLNKSSKERGTDSLAGADLTNNSETLSNVSKYFKFLEGTRLGNRLRGGSTATKLLTETEKLLLKEIRTYDINNDNEFAIKEGGTNLTKVKGDNGFIYVVNDKSTTKEAFNNELEKYFNHKVRSMGTDLNVAGVVEGLLKIQIIKSLGLNPIGGVFNRVEGMFSIMIMDETGEFWTPGNGDKAKEFMAFANVIKMSRKKFKFINGERVKQLEIFDALLQRLDVLQDRKDELQKSTDKSQVSLSSVPIFSWAVDNPEYKNQGTTILAVLMDTEITNSETGEVLPLFDGDKFNGLTMEDGVLTLDPNYSESFSLDNQNMLNSIVKMENAVSRVQGNYNPLDIMMAKKDWWGKAGMLFKTWFPESLNKRWGTASRTNSEYTPEHNLNISNQKEKRDGYMLRATKSNPMAMVGYIAGTIGLSFGALNLAAFVGGGALAGYAIYKTISLFSQGKVVKQEAHAVIDLGAFLLHTAIETVNMPSRVGSSIPGVKNLRLKNNVYSNTNLSPEDLGATKALARELAIMTSALMTKLALGLLLFDEEDEKTSHKRKFHNMLQNLMSRSITTLSVYSDPSTLMTDASSLMLERTISNLILGMKALIYDQDLDKAGGHFVKATPLPDAATKLAVYGKLPWEDNANYDFINFTGDNITKPMKWLSTYIEVSAEKQAEKAITKLRQDYKEKIEEEEPDMDDKYYRRAVMERYPAIESGQTYEDLLYDYTE